MLTDRVAGPVFTPGDEGYEAEIACHNTAIVHTPALVVGAESADDVAAAVQSARSEGLRVGVHSTGHAFVPVTSGVLVTTRRLDRLEIDPDAQTATIGTGVRWGAVVAAAARHGLAPVAGSSATVGVAGFLLGGGLGPLARSHGFGSDYLLGATVVTGTGDVVEADADHNPDLFWALRGGRGGFGIVTEVRIRLVELSTLYAGSLMFAESDIEPVLRTWVDWTATADPRVTTSVLVVRFPPLEQIPEPMRGQRFAILRFAFPGSAEEGEQLAAPLRAISPGVADSLWEMPPADVAQIHNDPAEPGPGWVTGLLLTHVDQDFVTAFLGGLNRDSPFAGGEIRHLGAATHRQVAEGDAVGGHSANFALSLVGANPATFAVLPEVAERLREALRPWTSPEANINFMGAPRSVEHFDSGWPAEARGRLAEVRRRYDPDGLFVYGAPLPDRDRG